MRSDWNKFFAAVTLISLSACFGFGENLYLCAKSTGAETGADWNNAWSSVAKVQWGNGAGKVGNGDTLWVGGGTYATLNVAAVGLPTGNINIRRAKTSLSSCTGTAGWNSSLDARVIWPITNLGATNVATYVISFENIWYVDKGAPTGGNGAAWSKAWQDTTSINWALVQPGDTIYLSAGATGTTYSSFATGRGGTQSTPLVIRRSEEVGHDGVVTLNASPLIIQHPNIILDGGQRDKFIIKVISAENKGAFGSINVYASADYFVLQNASVLGDFSGTFGHSVGIAAAHSTISHCKFVKSVYEDMLNFTGAGGSLTIEHSLFLNNTNNDTLHRDVMNPYVSGGYDLTVRGNLFVTAGDVFLIQNPTALGKVLIAYNVFYDVARGVAFGTGNQGAVSVAAYNNVFYGVTDSIQGYGSAETVLLNNLKKLKGSATVNRDDGSAVSNVSWSNVAAPLGADGIPFSSDDGFNLTAGSAAINAGAPTPETQDILAKPMVDAPDLGAYEFQGN